MITENLLYEDEIRSVEVPGASRAAPERTADQNCAVSAAVLSRKP